MITARAAVALLRTWALALSNADALSPEARRSARVVRAAAAAAIGHGSGFIAALAIVPLALGSLGSERYGAWAAIGSLLAWLRIADLGVGNGLTSALAAAWGRGDAEDARRWVTTAAATLGAITVLAAALLGCVAVIVDWGWALNVTSEAARDEVAVAVAVAFSLFVLELPLSPIDRVFNATGHGAVWSGWAVAANAASLAAVLFTSAGHGGLVALVAAFSGARLAVLGMAVVWFFVVRRPGLRPSRAHFDSGRAIRLAKSGGAFFAIQAAALVLYNTDNLVIARVLGAAHVAPYAIAWQLFLLPPAAMTLAFPHLWPAYAEALAVGDRAWIVNTLRRSVLASAVCGLILSALLVAIGRPIVRAWAGPEAVPSLALLAWMGAFSFLLSWMNAVACFLNALGRLRVQAVFGVAGAVVNIALSVVWGHRYGAEGVIAATVVVYGIVIACPSVIDAARALRKLRAAQAGLARGSP